MAYDDQGFAAAGVEDKVAQLQAVKDAAERFTAHLHGGTSMGDEAIELTKEVAD